ncbi:bifunctional riboflavin kinase/FMN phosphatase isoform X3 [Vitis vinifera]|uniref:bifunctional riboflavin kinase/FMN phosphatase isoform X3 n=1 Tax=Vitis vinifera TaxID=29760 RepID=UPI0008FEB971|nr:bifunctional riboflavin kinase/FMN phosphatase isoform X3 [Vitis vinifera]|eukprot:XP_019078785.1 PREDICTED: bifunctional riboflavin kinase/FMN phosphatase isoform X2 [Vitis vinifera]
MNGCCEPRCAVASRIQAVIFDLDGTLLDTEKFTKSTLKEFLENHGKVLDSENEDKRLGMGPQESAIDVIKEYDLPLTPQQFFDEIIPIYKEKFLEAAKRMVVDAAHCLVIEDSLVGVRAANAAGMKVVAVPPHSEADYASFADSVLHSLLEFQPELWDLPPFEDWVGSTLPIEPIYASGLFSNGFFCEAEDDEPSGFPDQVWGLYFGWAKLNTHEVFKVLVGVGRGHCTCTAKRKIKPWIIDDGKDHIADQHMHLSLVGFIRGLNNNETLMDLEVVEEEKSIASASLDLPMFLHHTRAPLFP